VVHLTPWPRTNDERPTTPNDCNRCNTVPSTFGQADERGSIRSKCPAEFFDEIVLSNSNTPEMMQEINPKTCRGGRPLVLAHADASIGFQGSATYRSSCPLSEFSLRSRRRFPGLKQARLASMQAMLKRARLRSKFGPSGSAIRPSSEKGHALV
jgi:hypothetical protein